MGDPGALDRRLRQLAGLFNAGSLDLPDGLFARGCVFRLNGVAYEYTMGRPASDPLVRLAARGPAAYRFLAQGLRHAVQGASASLDVVVGSRAAEGEPVFARARIRGTLRGRARPFEVSADVMLIADGHSALIEVSVDVDEAAVTAIVEARAVG